MEGRRQRYIGVHAQLMRKVLDTSQIATRLSHVPSPLAFLGYWYVRIPCFSLIRSFFFPAFLIGPSFEYSAYDSLVTGTIYSTPPPGIPAALNQGKRTPYGRKRVAYLHLIIGLAFLGLYAVYGGRAGYDRILSGDWKTWGRATRFGFIQFAGIMARTKYYAVWSLSEVCLCQ
jgi:lysophospholipid acyltransferase